MPPFPVKDYIVCRECGSPNVTRDALLEWDYDRQRWEISSHLDNCDCNDCGASGDDILEALEGDEAIAAMEISSWDCTDFHWLED